MSVRFVLGRAGTGKTAHCVQQIRNRLVDDPAGGNRLIFLVPEQASFQSERALLGEDVGGFHRCEVLSFQRLAYRILSDRGPALGVLSPYARTMVLRYLLEKNQSELRLFHRVSRSPGLASRLADTIVELIEQNITPEQLSPPAEQATGDPFLQAKLHDVALIYAAYQAYLANTHLDPAQYLAQAAEQLDQFDESKGFNGTELWVDGFAGFTGQELALLVRLMQLVRRTDLCFLIDPSTANRYDATGQGDPFDLFAPTLRTLSALRSAIAGAGLALDEPLILEPKPPHRFRNNPELARVEASIFARTPSPHQDTPVPSNEHIQLIETDDRRTEIAAAIAKIRRLVARDEAPLRYRDVAIVVRDLSVYHDLLAAELDAQHIPYFIDQRRSVSHHAWVELYRALVNVPADRFSLESIRLLLKTGLLPIDDGDGDALENYLIAHAIDSADAWFGPPWTYRRDMSRAVDSEKPTTSEQTELDLIHKCRNAFWQPLEPWLTFAREDRSRPIADWIAALRSGLGRIDADDRLEKWIQDARDDGELTLAEEHRLVREHVGAILDDLDAALGAESVDVRQFAALLDQGLGDLNVALAPPTIDQILVGSVERSRHPALRAVFVLGFNESMFPLSSSEDAVLNDADRCALAEAGMTLRPTRKQRLLDERLLAYIAVTRPSDYLWVSYALADEMGNPLRPSPFVDDLRAALPGLEAQPVKNPLDARKLWAIHTPGDLAEQLTLEWSARPSLDHDSRELRAPWNDLYVRAVDDVTIRPRLCRSLASLADDNAATLDAWLVEPLYRLPLTTSVSRLERFNECPFKHFVTHGLKLKERLTADLQASDLGTLAHKVLEDCIARLAADGRRLADLSDDDLAARVDAAFDQYADPLTTELASNHPRNQFQIEQNRRLLLDSLRAQRQFSRANAFVPFATELHFGFEGKDSLRALQIKTPNGNTVALRGMIDRIDVLSGQPDTLALVIDYKRTFDRKLSLDRVYHGLSLQLISYMLVLQDAGATLVGAPLVPVAAFYVSLRQRNKSQPGAPDEPLSDAQLAKRYKPRGLINVGHVADLDQALTTGQSDVLSAYIKKDGQIGRIGSTDLASAEAFAGLLDHVRKSLGQSADGIISGHVDVKPYRLGTESPCTYCEYRSCCRFEYDPARVNALNHIARDEVLRTVLHTVVDERSGQTHA